MIKGKLRQNFHYFYVYIIKDGFNQPSYSLDKYITCTFIYNNAKLALCYVML
jgi:hypothetical protein